MVRTKSYYEMRVNKLLTNGKNSESSGLIKKLQRKIRKLEF